MRLVSRGLRGTSPLRAGPAEVQEVPGHSGPLTRQTILFIVYLTPRVVFRMQPGGHSLQECILYRGWHSLQVGGPWCHWLKSASMIDMMLISAAAPTHQQLLFRISLPLVSKDRDRLSQNMNGQVFRESIHVSSLFL